MSKSKTNYHDLSIETFKNQLEINRSQNIHNHDNDNNKEKENG